MKGRAALALVAVLLLSACGPKPNTSAKTAAAADEASAPGSNPTLAPIALDPVSADFCQMRQQGPADLGAFFSAVESCDQMGDARARAEGRCNNLGADETRLRRKYAGNAMVLQSLERARARPWPVCAPPDDFDAPDQADDAAQGEEDQAAPDQSPAAEQ